MSQQDEMEKRQNEFKAQAELAEIAKSYPEYVNPLTSQVDTNRLYADLQAYTSGKGLKDIVAEMKGVKSPDVDKSMSAIEKNANKPSSVVASQETEKTPKKVDPGIKQIADAFGDIELPPDFDGLE